MVLPDAAPARPNRPSTVHAAFWSQLVTVGALLLLVGLVVAYGVHVNDQIDRAALAVPDADPVEVADERIFNIITSLVIAVPVLLMAIWLAVTAWPVRQGENVARIMVFVAGGVQPLISLGLCCFGVGSLPIAPLDGPTNEPDLPPDADSQAPWQESDFIETLYTESDAAGGILVAIGGALLFALVLLAVVVVLLATPSANRYFRPHVSPRALSAVTPPPTWSYPIPYGYVICPDPTLHRAAPQPASPVSELPMPSSGNGPDAPGDDGPPSPATPGS